MMLMQGTHEPSADNAGKNVTRNARREPRGTCLLDQNSHSHYLHTQTHTRFRTAATGGNVGGNLRERSNKLITMIQTTFLS